MLPNYLSTAKELYGIDWRKVKLQDDGASAHKAKACGAWMKDNWPGGVLLDHDTRNFHRPGNSPDLNPIEHVWSLLKDRLNSSGHHTNLKQLKLNAVRIWRDINAKQEWKPIIESFPNRLKEVRELEGRYTSY